MTLNDLLLAVLERYLCSAEDCRNQRGVYYEERGEDDEYVRYDIGFEDNGEGFECIGEVFLEKSTIIMYAQAWGKDQIEVDLNEATKDQIKKMFLMFDRKFYEKHPELRS